MEIPYSEVIMQSLDETAEAIAQHRPELSQAEVSLAAVRFSLLGLCEFLYWNYSEGRSLSNPEVFAMGMGLVEILDWCAAKDLADFVEKEQENF